MGSVWIILAMYPYTSYKCKKCPWHEYAILNGSSLLVTNHFSQKLFMYTVLIICVYVTPSFYTHSNPFQPFTVNILLFSFYQTEKSRREVGIKWWIILIVLGSSLPFFMSRIIWLLSPFFSSSLGERFDMFVKSPLLTIGLDESCYLGPLLECKLKVCWYNWKHCSAYLEWPQNWWLMQ